MAGAKDNTLCVWRTRDEKSVTERFTDLITALQWKVTQRGSASMMYYSIVSLADI